MKVYVNALSNMVKQTDTEMGEINYKVVGVETSESVVEKDGSSALNLVKEFGVHKEFTIVDSKFFLKLKRLFDKE
jgi:hypothetical protein